MAPAMARFLADLPTVKRVAARHPRALAFPGARRLVPVLHVALATAAALCAAAALLALAVRREPPERPTG